ncbi:MAG TPA: PIN domain-containing protein [Gammaproteobacteria bacterium]|nr:PIN domain-containing protein [Gammaproteobacteria bacterium]
MIATVFVDTNVFVYARDARDPRKQQLAEAWLRDLWREQRGRTSVQVLCEYYATITRKLRPGVPPDDAWGEVTELFEWEPQETNRDLLVRARDVQRRHTLSWWDSTVVAAAQAQGCSLLLTEDLQHGADLGGVTVRNPFREGIAEARAGYDAPLERVPRHRARGRPRRHTPSQ